MTDLSNVTLTSDMLFRVVSANHEDSKLLYSGTVGDFPAALRANKSWVTGGFADDQEADEFEGGDFEIIVNGVFLYPDFDVLEMVADGKLTDGYDVIVTATQPN